MQSDAKGYSLPRWPVMRWLIDAGPDVPDDIRRGLIGHLFGGLPVFFGGAINTVLVSAAIAIHTRTPLFIGWFVYEIAVCLARLAVLVYARRAAASGRETPTDLYFLLSLAWSSGVGYGAFISILSGDWMVATVACLSGAAMIGGICFRNFGAPRLAATMILTSIGPCLVGAVISKEPLLLIVCLQAPMYFFAMSAAAFKLNKMLAATMRAERENAHRALHDPLTGLSNRLGLVNAAEAKFRSAKARDQSLSLLFLDLDGFKAVNDTYGHAAGDEVLMKVAQRLHQMLGPNDIAARIGGDEFVMLADDLNETCTLALAERLIESISLTYDVGNGVAARIGLSVGIAMAPEHGSSIEDILAAADLALYQAKSRGKSQSCMASATANVAALQRLAEPTASPDGAIAAA